MLRVDKVIKPWKESAALNDHINLYGFWNETTFLTKSGDVGMVLSVPGVDYESLDRPEQEYAVKRLEAALKAFGPGFHVYQYLFKSNRPDIPFAKYDDPIVEAAIEQRRKFFEAKRDHLYQVEIFYCILLEGARSKTGVSAAFGQLFRDPAGAMGELKAQFTNNNMKTLLRTHIERDVARLDQRVQAFARQLRDFMQIEVLNRQGQFTFFRRLLNFDDWRVAGKPQSTQFLDYQVVNSNIEAERDHLRVGDHIIRVLTMKEAITETRPLALDALLKIPANFRVITEWTPLAADKARKEVNKRRRHFNMSKTGFVSQMGNDATKTNPRDVLVDESKQADIENLGDCLRALGDGQSLGDFSLTIVLYGRSQAQLEQLGAEFTGIFTNADGNLFAETYNQLNAYFATVPGNYALNLRRLYLLKTNYADLSFLFTILPGEKTNAHLGSEYLAVLETDNSTPYFLNLHNGEVAHTLILGMTGSGNTFFPNSVSGARFRTMCDPDSREANELERLCDLAASELLMPFEEFSRATRNQMGLHLVDGISTVFGSSYESTVFRLATAHPGIAAAGLLRYRLRKGEERALAVQEQQQYLFEKPVQSSAEGAIPKYRRQSFYTSEPCRDEHMVRWNKSFDCSSCVYDAGLNSGIHRALEALPNNSDTVGKIEAIRALYQRDVAHPVCGDVLFLWWL